MTEIRALREQIVGYGRSLFDRGLTAGSSGNISVRVDDGWLMTPTNSSLGRLEASSLSHLRSDGTLVAGDPPTKEALLHRAVYRVRGDAGAVVHLHSHWSVAVSVHADVDTANVLPPLTPYQVMKVGRLPLVPYFRPGDPAVALAISDLARTHAAVLLANHGPVVAAESLDAAVNAIEELEATAKLFLSLSGRNVRHLTDAQLDKLRSVFGVAW